MSAKNRIKGKIFLLEGVKPIFDKDHFSFQKSINNNNIKTINDKDNCILDKKCPNYKKFVKIKNKIISYMSSCEKLKLIVQSLYLTLSEKNKINKEIKEENYFQL